MYSDKDYSLYDGIPKEFKFIRNKEFNDWEIPPWDIIIHRDTLIGNGEHGNVYLAKWKETQVVVKVMSQHIEPEKKHLFINEFDTLSKAHHPNIVQLLGYIEDPFIIIMEYLPSFNLLHYIQHNILSIDEKINVCLDILKGIDYLHSRKPQSMIHRDIKPQNIILNESKKAKIGDFGLCKLFNTHLHKTPSSENLIKTISSEDLTNHVGTRRYMSPEIIKQSSYNHKIDIWSLGIMFAELFENRRYNEEFFWKKTPQNIQQIIIQHMLRENPSDRLKANEIIQIFKCVQNERKLNVTHCSCMIC